MKYFTLIMLKKMLSLLFFSTLALGAFSQNAPVDFETGGNGLDWTWTVFENVDNPALEIIANPDASGANTSATVAKFTALQAGAPWAGCETMHGADIGTFTMDASNSIISIMVWKTEISDVGIKLVESFGGSLGEIKIANTLVNQWEEITFDFSAHIGAVYDQIVVFPDFTERAQDNVIYFDNITFGESVVTEGPMTAAPDPTIEAEKVISMFSNVYTDVAVDTWRTDWSDATLEDIQIVGNDTKKYSALNFVGVETVGDNLIDASGMTHFHMDVWTADMTTVRIKLVDFGADGAFAGGDDSEHELVFDDQAQGEWVSYNIPLTDFAGLASAEHMAQFIFSGLPTGTIYVDNVYFSNGDVVVIEEPMVAAPDPTIDEAKVISLFSNVYTDVAVDTWRTDWSDATLEDIQIVGNDTKKYSALNFVGVETVGGNVIDATSMTHFRIDVWTPDMTTVRFKLVDFGADGAFAGGDDTEHEIVFENHAQGEWVTYEIPLTDFTGLLNKAHLAQYIFSGLPSGTLYVDNVFFYNDLVNTNTFEASAVDLFPNPATSNITIRSEQNIEAVSIYNMTGALMMTANTSTNELTLDISELASGMYVVSAIVDGEVVVDRLIVE